MYRYGRGLRRLYDAVRPRRAAARRHHGGRHRHGEALVAADTSSRLKTYARVPMQVLQRLFVMRIRLGHFNPPGPLANIGVDQVRLLALLT